MQGWKTVLASQVGAVWDLLLGYTVGHLTWGKDVSQSSKRKILSKASLGFKIPGGIELTLCGLAESGACSRKWSWKDNSGQENDGGPSGGESRARNGAAGRR